jgi:ABC-2 type transport system ATP-binding protein
MICVQDFHKAYGATRAVSGLSFTVKPGQVLGLVGHNGAGKTTTLRAIAGLLGPSRGKLVVAGYDLDSHALDAKARLAYLPDDPQLFGSLTVGEHMAFTAAAYRIPNHQDQAAALLRYFELETRLNSPAESLSRGMRQKLAICCGYLHNPAAILFDEPFTGLDPRAIRRLKDSIRERADTGCGIIVSSHLLAMVDDLCSHFLVLAAGRTKFLGTHEELFATFDGAGDATSLEDIFFRATDDEFAGCR